MSIKQVGAGDDAGWEVAVVGCRTRLFVWRKLGGKEPARAIAEQEEQAMKATRPPLLQRLMSRLPGRAAR